MYDLKGKVNGNLKSFLNVQINYVIQFTYNCITHEFIERCVGRKFCYIFKLHVFAI